MKELVLGAGRVQGDLLVCVRGRWYINLPLPLPSSFPPEHGGCLDLLQTGCSPPTLGSPPWGLQLMRIYRRLGLLLKDSELE